MRIAVSPWHKTLGKLCSMSLAIPGLCGLFSLLQEALWHQHKQRICLTHEAHDFLDDICWVGARSSPASHLFSQSCVVPTTPVLHGACDAAKSGMGGVFFAPTPSGELFPCLWGTPFPSEIQNQVVLWDNLSGTITHSDLELAGTIMHHDVANHAVDLRECTISTLNYKTPALARQTKGSTTTVGPAAYLLRLQALHQQSQHYLPQLAYIPGPANVMADDCVVGTYQTCSFSPISTPFTRRRNPGGYARCVPNGFPQ